MSCSTWLESSGCHLLPDIYLSSHGTGRIPSKANTCLTTAASQAIPKGRMLLVAAGRLGQLQECPEVEGMREKLEHNPEETALSV